MLLADGGDRQRNLSMASVPSECESESVEQASSDGSGPSSSKHAKIGGVSAANAQREGQKDSSSLIPTSWEPNWDTSVYKRKKNCKKRRDPMEPQNRPVSAYALFFRDTQAAIKSRNPKASFGDISKTVASMWDTLDGETKNQYKKRTDMAKKEYLKRLAAYRARLISTVTAGFCGQQSYNLMHSESNNIGACSPLSARIAQNDSIYRTPTSLASYGGFENYALRSGNNNYYALANQSNEQLESSYHAAKLDASRIGCQQYESGTAPISQCSQASGYCGYSKMNLSNDCVATNSSTNSSAYSTHRASGSGNERGDYVSRASIGASNDSVANYSSDCNSSNGAQSTPTYSAPASRMSLTSGACYDMTMRPQPNGPVVSVPVPLVSLPVATASSAGYGGYYRPSQNLAYSSDLMTKPSTYPTNGYSPYWPTTMTMPMSMSMSMSIDAQRVSQAQNGNGSATLNHYSLPSASSSSSSASASMSASTAEEASATTTAVRASPSDGIAHHSATERAGSFDYWTNAIGYY